MKLKILKTHGDGDGGHDGEGADNGVRVALPGSPASIDDLKLFYAVHRLAGLSILVEDEEDLHIAWNGCKDALASNLVTGYELVQSAYWNVETDGECPGFNEIPGLVLDWREEYTALVAVNIGGIAGSDGDDLDVRVLTIPVDELESVDRGISQKDDLEGLLRVVQAAARLNGAQGMPKDGPDGQ
jgi:hypothetical protein